MKADIQKMVLALNELLAAFYPDVEPKKGYVLTEFQAAKLANAVKVARMLSE
jgi:hypothetical protein